MRWPISPGRDSRHPSAGFDINWPYRLEQMMHALTAATGTGTVNEHALPVDLRAKRIHLGHHGHPHPPLNRHNWRHHPRWHYSRPERHALKAAIVHWPASRDELATFANGDILQAEWDTRFSDTPPSHPGAAAAVWREPNVVAVAHMSAQSARCSRIWKTTILDEHHARLDVDATMHTITSHAYRLWRTHADTHLSLGTTDNDDDWNALIDRIDLLAEYAHQLNGRTDLLVAYREILRLDDVDDDAIRIEFGLHRDEPVDRDRLDQEIQSELAVIARSLATDILPRLQEHSA